MRKDMRFADRRERKTKDKKPIPKEGGKEGRYKLKGKRKIST